MTLKEIAPGLYERTDTRKRVKITREFQEAVSKNSGSPVLDEVLEATVREQERQKVDGSQAPQLGSWPE